MGGCRSGPERAEIRKKRWVIKRQEEGEGHRESESQEQAETRRSTVGTEG